MSEQSTKPEIIVADDSRVIRRTITKFLSDQYSIHECVDGQEAWDLLNKEENIRLVLTDIGMPKMDGYQLIEAVRSSDNNSIAQIPILVITGNEDSVREKEKVVNLGATDLVGKPFDKSELISRVRSYINYRSRVNELEKTSPLDPLTGLVTREYFLDQGSKTFAMSVRHGYEITVVRMKMDGFERLCERFGKKVAESVVKKIGAMIKSTLRTEDIAAYFPDAEFGLLLHFADSDEAEQVQRRIFKEVDHLRLKIGQEVVSVPFYAGIVTESVETTFSDFNHMLEHADIALQSAISSNTETVRYTSEIESASAQEPASEQPVTTVDINELLARLDSEPESVTEHELKGAMKQLLPLMEKANELAKLGLGKMIPYLKRKLG